MNSLQAEVNANKLKEMKEAVEAEMDACWDTAEKAYGLCVKSKSKREAEEKLHRNYQVLGQVPICQKEPTLVQSKLFSEDQLAVMLKQKANVDQWYQFITNYGSQTEIGVISMPCENFAKVNLNAVRRHGVADRLRPALTTVDVICTNYDFGHFGFVKPSSPDVPVTHMVHHISKLTMLMPFSLQIPQVDISCGSAEKFQIVRWASLEQALVKGPGGMSFVIIKHFLHSDQKKIRRLTPPPAKTMLQDQTDMRLALKPLKSSPDVIPSLRTDSCSGRKRKASNQPEEEHLAPHAIDSDSDDAPVSALQPPSPRHPLQAAAAAGESARAKAAANAADEFAAAAAAAEFLEEPPEDDESGDETPTDDVRVLKSRHDEKEERKKRKLGLRTSRVLKVRRQHKPFMPPSLVAAEASEQEGEEEREEKEEEEAAQAGSEKDDDDGKNDVAVEVIAVEGIAEDDDSKKDVAVEEEAEDDDKSKEKSSGAEEAASDDPAFQTPVKPTKGSLQKHVVQDGKNLEKTLAADFCDVQDPDLIVSAAAVVDAL